MNSVPGAADDSLLEEMRTGNLERECNEETCDWAEAYEIFGDKAQTDDFMYNRLHQCEIKNPTPFNLKRYGSLRGLTDWRKSQIVKS